MSHLIPTRRFRPTNPIFISEGVRPRRGSNCRPASIRFSWCWATPSIIRSTPRLFRRKSRSPLNSIGGPTPLAQADLSTASPNSDVGRRRVVKSVSFLFPKSVVGRYSGCIGGKFGSNAIEVIHIHQSLVLHFDGAPGVCLEPHFDVLPGRFGNADA